MAQTPVRRVRPATRQAPAAKARPKSPTIARIAQLRHSALSDLLPDAKNANKGTDRGRDLLDQSIKKYGAGRSVLIDKKGRIIAGNKTVQSALNAGHKDVLVVQTDGSKIIAVQRTDLDLLTDKRAKELAIADNRVGELDLSWNEDILKSLDVDLSQFWNESELRKLIGQEFEEAPEPQLDRAAELQKKWGTERGQIWEIGRHRLMCGDSQSDLAALTDGRKPDLLFTDPPYGIALLGKDGGRVGGGTREFPTHHFSEVIGDDQAFDPVPLLEYATDQIIFGANYFAHLLPPSKCWFVWDKQHPVERTFCGCELAWTSLDRHSKVYHCTWDGWTKEGENESKVHPTQKPSKLFSEILNDLKELTVILDTYAGSGTTMVAAEQTGRTCYGMEIEPKYVAVALEPLSDMGLKPKRVKS